MHRRPAKHTAAVMARSLLTTLASPEYARARDDDGRAWTLLLALCDALHPLGPVVLPPRARVVERVRRIERDEVIWRAFNGTNYAALALKHRLTVRQIRRIVERMRRRGPGK